MKHGVVLLTQFTVFTPTMPPTHEPYKFNSAIKDRQKNDTNRKTHITISFSYVYLNGLQRGSVPSVPYNRQNNNIPQHHIQYK